MHRPSLSVPQPSPPPDLADERDTDSIRAALDSGDKSITLDLASLIKNPEKLKKACRNGLPMPQRREIWRALFDLNTQKVPLDYHSAKLEIFNGIAHPTHFPHIPDFGSMMKWNEAYIHLTPKRINHAKTILCVLACSHATLTHCPFLPDLTCVLLIFFDESTTYEVLERMLARSKADEFYFTTNGSDFLKWMKTFSILLEQKNKELFDHMHKVLKLDSGKLFQVWLSRFFIQYMPMRTVFRIIDAFLCEGNKILFRVSLAVLKLYTKDLLQCKTQHEFLVKLHERMTKQTPNDLLATGFDIYLSRSSHMDKIKSHLHENQNTLLANPPNSRHTTHFHLPRFTKEHDHVSELISIQELYSLWSWLPPQSMICDPVLLYSSSIHGYSYHTLWNKCCERVVGENTAIFMLIRDASSDQVLGLYLNKALPDPPEMRHGAHKAVSLYTGHNGATNSATTSPLPLDPLSFLFVLKPFTESYKHHVIKKEELARTAEFRITQERLSLDHAGHQRSNSKVPPFTRIPTHTAETSEESRSFKPYGIAKLLDDPITSNNSGLNETTGNPHGLTIHQEQLYQNTVGTYSGTIHTPNPHVKRMNSLGSTDPAMSSHSLIVGPSRPINKSQPLNELFGSLENAPSPHPTSILEHHEHHLVHASSAASTTSDSEAVDAHLLTAHAMEHAASLANSPQSAANLHLPDGHQFNSLALPPSVANQLPHPLVLSDTPDHLHTPRKSDEEKSGEISIDVLAAAESALAIAAASASPPLPIPTPNLDEHSSENGHASATSPLARQASVRRDSSIDEIRSPEAMLLMTDEGFGIVETGGVVLFLSGDLKNGISGPSVVFGSPRFTQYQGRKSATGSSSSKGTTDSSSSSSQNGVQSALQRGRFAISTIEVWSFVTPGSEAIQQLSPRVRSKEELELRKNAGGTRMALPTITANTTSTTADSTNLF